MKMLYLIIAASIIALIVLLKILTKDEAPAQTQLSDSNLYMAPAGESAERAGKVLPSEGTEDVSHLLPKLDLPTPDYFSKEEKDYLPEEAVNWVVTVTFSEGKSFTRDELKAIFDEEWKEKYGSPTLYGLDPESGFWTYVIYGDSPPQFTSLKLAWDYYTSWKDEPLATEADYQNRLESVESKLAKFDPLSLEATHSPKDAGRRSEALKVAHTNLDREAFILLQAPEGKLFEGREIWDVMLCLGLRWGDMDLFHWNNEGTIGDDAYFSVWTSTSPGYFFPELIAEGKVRTHDLAFGYSIPRSASPQEIFKAMYQSAQYCQKRLGGTLVNNEGTPLDFEQESEEIEKIVQGLKSLGFPPGESRTLQLF